MTHTCGVKLAIYFVLKTINPIEDLFLNVPGKIENREGKLYAEPNLGYNFYMLTSMDTQAWTNAVSGLTLLGY